MKERPIIFNGEMVRAILEGRKTQTRRVIKPQPEYKENSSVRGHFGTFFHGWNLDHSAVSIDDIAEYCPFGSAGAKLWVRETWRQHYARTHYSEGIVYRADAMKALGAGSHSDSYKWKPSIHMPRKFCRLLLDVKSVRVERLQDIREEDAEAEGAGYCNVCGDTNTNFLGDDTCPANCGALSYREEFAKLWESINGKRGFGWKENPFVWAIELKRSEQVAK